MSANININHLRQTVQFLVYTRITWENYINKKRLTQCHRCQAWGHATANCYAEPRCLKCAQKHLTNECKKPKTEPAKCINCGKAHPANATICMEYQFRLELIKTRNINKTQKEKAKVNFKPVPNIGNQVDFPGITKVVKQRLPFNDIVNYPNIHTPHMQLNQDKDKHLISNRDQYSTVVTKGIDHADNNNIETSNSSNILSDFLALNKEIRELNNIINIPKMLKAIREFKNQLKHCQKAGEQFELLLNFCQNLNNE
ncbi:hypothetical protein KPH14_012825 [Odynerus spinipes]|uniref:Nucleic-acid-binding protein from transposon X-element n=1 Tax=Odynerus spinipes TaxID=1348599 RepID=A0AAD9RE02_9HYME|nr:hypothetical protein KPH14_012825 [Odynerus spinipes]